MRDKRELWKMIAASAIMSGRKTVAEAAGAADAMTEEYEQRVPKWEAEEATRGRD